MSLKPITNDDLLKLMQLRDQLNFAADYLDDVVEALAVGKIPPEIVAPIVPIIDARIPPIIDAIQVFAPLPPGFSDWLPPWKVEPPELLTDMWTTPIYVKEDETE